jgi:hypothetical protein
VAEQPPQKLEEVVQSPQKLKRRVVKMKMGWSNHPKICGSGSAAPFVLFIFKKKIKKLRVFWREKNKVVTSRTHDLFLRPF